MPLQSQFTSAPKWSYLGGILGGTYILLIVISAPKLSSQYNRYGFAGAGFSSSDHQSVWLSGAQVHIMSWPRLTGVILLVTGVYLVKNF